MSQLDFLHGVDVVEIEDAIRPIRTQKSSVIGLVGTAGQGPVNQPTLVIGSRREAVALFGLHRNDGFTIPAALDAIFDQGGATVVVVNVCDPEEGTNQVEVADEVITFSGATASLAFGNLTSVSDFGVDNDISAPYIVTTAGQITLPSGCTLTEVRNFATNAVINPEGGGGYTSLTLPLGLKVKVAYTATLAHNTDYTLNLVTGVVTRISDGSKILPGATLTVTYTKVDPSNIDNDLIIGEVDTDGNASGIQCLVDAKSKVAVQPRILIAPGFTHTKADVVTRNPVAVELESVAVKLKAIAVVDCPNTTREEAVAYRNDFGSDRIYAHYPFYRVLPPYNGGVIIDQPASARIAGVMSFVDNEEGFWFSPSNHQVAGVLGLSKPIDFSLSNGDTTANYLNSNYVTTSIQEQGFRLWGNRVASGAFISVRRTADMVEESILYAHLWAVDRNITKGYVEAIVGGVKEYLRRLTALGAVLGGNAWADPSLNTPTSIADGNLFIDFDFTAPRPAERITFRAHLVNTYVSSIFDGE